MGRKKQTFLDPQTGEEIESTTLARWGAALAFRLYVGLGVGMCCGLGVGLLFGLLCGPLLGLFAGLVAGLHFGLVAGLVIGPGEAQIDPFPNQVHNWIARWQHLFRQRPHQPPLFPHVPDRALSRAQARTEPEPTAASLSRDKEQAEGPPRLAEAVDVATASEGNPLGAEDRP